MTATCKRESSHKANRLVAAGASRRLRHACLWTRTGLRVFHGPAPHLLDLGYRRERILAVGRQYLLARYKISGS